MVPNLRWEDELSARSQPPPALPDGPAHRLSGNYYYVRDGRSLVTNPEHIIGYDELKKLPLQK